MNGSIPDKINYVIGVSVRHQIAFVGHSHINCIKVAFDRLGEVSPVSAKFVQLRQKKYGNTAQFKDAIHMAIKPDLIAATRQASLCVLCPGGNAHNVVALVKSSQADKSPKRSRINSLHRLIRPLMADYAKWLDYLRKTLQVPTVIIPPPPPFESDELILNNPGKFRERIMSNGLESPDVRINVYEEVVRQIKEIAIANELSFLELPDEVKNEKGFLQDRYWGGNPTHGNDAYGEVILHHVQSYLKDMEVQNPPSQNMKEAPNRAETVDRQHPYTNLPDWAFWKQGVSKVDRGAFDPVVDVPFRISRMDYVATAGSCFAQHISKRLRCGGFRFMAMEDKAGSGMSGESEVNYDFSARYGNIYTARQLTQLFDRAFGYFTPIETHWVRTDDRYCDPFRPRIEADGFPTVEALTEDRRNHLAAVRQMFEELDYFVFTLGLTESWISKLDGAAYPLAPGVAGGVFDQAKHQFVNFGYDDVVKDLNSFIGKLRLVNPGAKLILTVSPVPLAATYTENHVLCATTYSKSVLRIAAETISRSFEGVYYFPSYEIITGNYNRGRYFGPDMRSVTEEGVDHVMSVFMRHLTEMDATGLTTIAQDEEDDETLEMMALAEAACDEELLSKK